MRRTGSVAVLSCGAGPGDVGGIGLGIGGHVDVTAAAAHTCLEDLFAVRAGEEVEDGGDGHLVEDRMALEERCKLHKWPQPFRWYMVQVGPANACRDWPHGSTLFGPQLLPRGESSGRRAVPKPSQRLPSTCTRIADVTTVRRVLGRGVRTAATAAHTKDVATHVAVPAVAEFVTCDAAWPLILQEEPPLKT